MKALSIMQPWAWMILHAGKCVENRTWPSRYRGSLLIHTGKRFDDEGYRWIVAHSHIVLSDEIPPPERYERGGIVGTVKMIGCVHDLRSPWFFGPFGFLFKDPQPMGFIPYRGARGLFDVPDTLIKGGGGTPWIG